MKKRSDLRFVRFFADVKRWIAEGPPSVETLRPGRCPCCGASRGALHGHGLRARSAFMQRAGRTVALEVLARRYVCCRCDAVITVVPAELAHRHLYTRQVIALALATWAYAGLSAREVRAAYALGQHVGASALGWPALARWARSAARLWRALRPLAEPASPRALALGVSTQLAAHCPVPVGRVLDDIVLGGVHAA
jgi:transposase